MLLIDDVKYELWIPPSEDALEQMIKEHAQDIFGEEAEFFNKQRLESELGKGSVPDGFVVIFGPSSRWYIVEVELSVHDVHKHIVEQHSRFIMGIRSSETKNKIVKAIYNEIDKDASRKQKLKKAIEPDEIYRFLHEVISKPPVLTIIVEKPIQGLDETLKALSRDTISDIKVVEFQTFVQKNVGLGAHVHLFEPLYPVVTPKPTIVLEQTKSSPATTKIAVQGSLEIIVKPACIRFHLFFIPKHSRRFFPGYRVPFKLETDVMEIETYVTSARAGTQVGDPDAGAYIQANLAEWYRRHPEIKVGDRVILELIEPMKRYRLKKA
ncbi:MAG: hypothetical protein ABSB38_00265 [Dehalococcoidia bacterium]|jgi:hypothetical protein